MIRSCGAQGLFASLIRPQVLHHAAEGDVYGHRMIEKLARHRYRLPPGTIYALLHGLEDKEYLESWQERAGARIRGPTALRPQAAPR